MDVKLNLVQLHQELQIMITRKRNNYFDSTCTDSKYRQGCVFLPDECQSMSENKVYKKRGFLLLQPMHLQII
ncbi:unnamed protein product [Paramecium octaurelia]|uniref:Uncharacterized protein n=1 Tax=Paramecium octaurelia TaxID=43137 RepID=A0A8S1XQI5_PAROT|nr:unnamed protein product [Paramecium octaurelia]